MSLSTITKALVIGGTGMIGSALAKTLLTRGVEVFVFSRPGVNRMRLNGLPGVSVIEGDILLPASISDAIAFSRPDVVFHLASTPFNPPTIPAQEHFEVNILGVANLIEALQPSPNIKLVYTGSAAVYGSASGAPEISALMPSTVLGATKAAASCLLCAHGRMTGRRVVELRLFTPYGPGERASRIIPTVILSALAGKTVETSEGYQERDFVYIDDVLDALILAAEGENSGPAIFNIGSGKGIQIRQLVGMVLEIMGNPVEVNYGAVPTRPDEIMTMTANIIQARKELGWYPKIAIEAGLERTINWVSENRKLVANLT